ncbi:16S rRNA (guanine1207-N2)-methyltransferase [Scopulibacillus daqui]|uniref:16S rRNA (Guanine1207-N2)-methyltransferase n=1 Tax=Scopulibacillus daqui TaxID=1469162 RepID=A0ABS2Q3N2_9BACL|nr:class I SAM-dependent methyltransferase [Scopulibacillus daqui]MBM7646731.1 16S rRNA (guanine1207-N2)-methyltransferase [Scopulibacillus daqui]
MSEHYYSKNPQTESAPREITAHLRGMEMSFITDRGVFSKDDVDFGSKLLINTFIPPEMKGPILDVGCGYGAIGLTIAKAFPDRAITMVDINERAVQLAQENAKKNNISAQIFFSNIYENVKGLYAAILTNPPIRAGKKIVHQIFRQGYEHLHPEGELWVVIQKKQGAPSAMKALEEIYDHVETVERKKGYYILRARKS